MTVGKFIQKPDKMIIVTIEKKFIVIIQARTGSKRFPNKVLARIEKKPLIWHVISRVKQTKGINQIVLATTKHDDDKILLKIAKEEGIIGFAGNSTDVLARFYNCARKINADNIIRITGDCPLIDHKIIEKMIKIFKENNYDYVTNIYPPTFPDGLDVEIFSSKVLKTVHQRARLKSDREHVTTYIKKHNQKFQIFNFECKNDLSHYRWTVDEPVDLKLVRVIYKKMRPKKLFSMEEILKIFSKNPEIFKINKEIERNEGLKRSLKNDKKVSKNHK